MATYSNDIRSTSTDYTNTLTQETLTPETLAQDGRRYATPVIITVAAVIVSTVTLPLIMLTALAVGGWVLLQLLSNHDAALTNGMQTIAPVNAAQFEPVQDEVVEIHAPQVSALV